jgi:beta-lactamase class A
MTRTIAFLAILAFVRPAVAEKPDRPGTLESQLAAMVSGFHGIAGIYVYCPSRKLEIAIQADTVFPTASMVKVPILCTLWEQIATGRLNPDSVVRFYPDSIHYPYKAEDALARFAPGEDINIRHLMSHMITFSDNMASLYLQQLAGGGEKVNEWLEKGGFLYTRVNSRTPGREGARTVFGWGQTTPREMATLVWKIRQGMVVSPAVSDAVYRHLTRVYWNGEALSQIPPDIQTASKQGAVDESKSEVVLVNAPHGDYVFCVITKNAVDTRWERDNESYVLIRNISALLWRFFEPHRPYKPVDLKYYP